MTELERDLLNTLGGAVIGALLVMAWDIIKHRRDSHKRDAASIVAILHNLDENRRVCQENIDALRVELDYLERNKTLIEPVIALDDSLWQLLRLQLPRNIAASPQLLGFMSYIFQRIGYINRVIASRETYRHTTGDKATYKSRMAKYDRAIVEYSESLWQALWDFEQSLTAKASLWEHIKAIIKKLVTHHA